MKRIIICILSVILFLVLSLHAQDSTLNTPTPQTGNANSKINSTSVMPDSTENMTRIPPSVQNDFHWIDSVPWVIAFLAFLFGVYQYSRRITETKIKKRAEKEEEKSYQDEQEEENHQTGEKAYLSVLKKELGTIRILGSPDIENLPVNLLDTFVPLDISETWRSEKRFDPGKHLESEQAHHDCSPEMIIKHAFSRHQMLLIIGDPGSGKTTLLKYYAMCCLTGDQYKTIGFDQSVLPLYLPLREIAFVNGKPANLPENLENWAKDHVLDISADTFSFWLHNRQTLILLDGLDEISDIEHRRKVCEWIDKTAAGCKNARFIVTSRWTGYRKLDGIEIGSDHLRADVKDFTPEKQEEFLRKWFCAVYRHEIEDGAVNAAESTEKQTQIALHKAKKIVDFLQKKENKGIRELASVPMLLQIMAIIWKEREHLPQSRQELYRAALNYLLDFRDRKRRLDPVLPADKAVRVLSPAALWMQEEIGKDEVDKERMHDYMREKLNRFDKPPGAEAFCQNLRDRAGLIAEYGKHSYIFRHKSFREYLAGLQLARESREANYMKKLVLHFGEDWWEEPLRYFISESDAEIFNRFLDALFRSKISRELDQKAQNLLQTLIMEAPERETEALGRRLNDRRMSEIKKRYILECLKTIGSPEAIKLVNAYAAQAGGSDSIKNYAEEVGSILTSVSEKIEKFESRTAFLKTRPLSFNHTFEANARYILIPGGRFIYSKTKEMTEIPDIYFAQYPVTNRRFRMFIAYLSEKASELHDILPVDTFESVLLAYTGSIRGFEKYLSESSKEWGQLFRSVYDIDKKFNNPDQPVVGITWYAATAYCVWLTLVEKASEKHMKKHIGKFSYLDASALYRLPGDKEWEWAAAGREPDGILRKYPWLKAKGEPGDKLANFNMNVGTTTPVGRYPEGATLEGLMDMAGNVWEWCRDWYDEEKERRVLRGGSFDDYPGSLRCSFRSGDFPVNRNYVIGFRVVRVLRS